MLSVPERVLTVARLDTGPANSGPAPALVLRHAGLLAANGLVDSVWTRLHALFSVPEEAPIAILAGLAGGSCTFVALDRTLQRSRLRTRLHTKLIPAFLEEFSAFLGALALTQTETLCRGLVNILPALFTRDALLTVPERLTRIFTLARRANQVRVPRPRAGGDALGSVPEDAVVLLFSARDAHQVIRQVRSAVRALLHALGAVPERAAIGKRAPSALVIIPNWSEWV